VRIADLRTENEDMATAACDCSLTASNVGSGSAARIMDVRFRLQFRHLDCTITQSLFQRRWIPDHQTTPSLLIAH